MRKVVNMLKYLAKTSKTPAVDVVVVRDGEEVHRSAENDRREKHQAKVKRKAFPWVKLTDDKMFCDVCLASSNLMLVHYLI